MKILYKEFRFSQATLDLVETCDNIISDYQEQGYLLTLRQLYYALVSRDIIPNKLTEYSRLGGIVNDARLAGLLDWNAIEDRTRNLEALSKWETPSDIISDAADTFHVDLWKGQDYRPEVWIEKDALVGVIEPICNGLDVAFFSCRGYTSQSEMWRAGMRLKGYIRQGQTPIIFHFGDHDPSGQDMSRDIRERLQLFIGSKYKHGRDFEIIRIALNMDQIKHYNPPPNPAKFTDSRCKSYVEKFGRSSWELDALEPRVITNLIRDSIAKYLDNEQFAHQLKVREDGRDLLSKVLANWEDVKKRLE